MKFIFTILFTLILSSCLQLSENKNESNSSSASESSDVMVSRNLMPVQKVDFSSALKPIGDFESVT